MADESLSHDALESPGVRSRVMVYGAIGVLVFLAVALTLLTVFYKVVVGGETAPQPRPFPMPRLETNTDPRGLPAVLPGPSQTSVPQNPAPDDAILQQAMAAIAAKGVHAYDPLGSARATPAGGAQAGSPTREAANQSSGAAAQAARAGVRP